MHTVKLKMYNKKINTIYQNAFLKGSFKIPNSIGTIITKNYLPNGDSFFIDSDTLWKQYKDRYLSIGKILGGSDQIWFNRMYYLKWNKFQRITQLAFGLNYRPKKFLIEQHNTKIPNYYFIRFYTEKI